MWCVGVWCVWCGVGVCMWCGVCVFVVCGCVQYSILFFSIRVMKDFEQLSD